ncbi:hypothetical protein [Microbacterium sp. zg-YB36]|uniref:hypothetical protein n=1 Tax=Microbacterium sp. zg-YB36 TaxID=2969407 RepID=UPI00214B9FB8|nr:hypothetical protein [Microbacterium sp. zg-YB36]MDL5351131.1 hypothetical protein [Microbacterium sp. zg-YB36]
MGFKEDVARRVALLEQRNNIEDEIALIDSRLLEEHSYGTHDAGDWSLIVSHNRRLNPEAIQARYPVAQFPHLYKPAVNTEAVKKHIAPVELDELYSEGKPRLVVK